MLLFCGKSSHSVSQSIYLSICLSIKLLYSTFVNALSWFTFAFTFSFSTIFFFYYVYVLYELSGHPSLLVFVYVLSGSTPYENIRGRDLPGRLKKGERLPKPENSDDTWVGLCSLRIFDSVLILSHFEPPHDKTNNVVVCPVKTQISLGIRPVWSESSLCTQWVAKNPSFLHADSEDSDQTGRMPRLIWVFAGRTLILLVLSCCGSYCIILLYVSF